MLNAEMIEQRRVPLFLGAALFIWLVSSPQTSCALRSYILSPDTALYGNTRYVKADDEDTFLDIAREFGLGYNQIVAANPGVEPWVPAKGSLVLVPLAFLLPQDRLHSGIVVNLAEMRLYYFFSNGGHDYFLTVPIGIGAEGFGLCPCGSHLGLGCGLLGAGCRAFEAHAHALQPVADGFGPGGGAKKKS